MIFKNAYIFTENGRLEKGGFRVENGKFCEIFTDTQAQYGIDLKNAWVIPGLVDIHTHGNSGADFSNGDYQGIKNMAAV